MSTSEERGRIAKEHKLNHEQIIDLARCLKAKGYSNAATAHILRIPESVVRTLILEKEAEEGVRWIKEHNLAVDNSSFKIEGPWAFKAQEGMEAEAYIFKPGGERVIVGKVTARIRKPGGLKFELELDEEYKDIKSAGFEIPMRFNLIQKQTQTEGE